MKHPYIPNTQQDEKEMLDALGFESLDDLFEVIPADLKLNRDLDIPESKSEMEVSKYLSSLAKQNTTIDDLTCFLGAGAYDHYIPSIISHLSGRQEFYTSYTPYQAEVSQGTLRVIFEFQTMISELTGMEVTNASMYDGGTALAEAAFMAVRVNRNKKNKIIVSETVSPEYRRVLDTYKNFQNIEVVTIPHKDGVTDLDALEKEIDENTAGVIVQSPNFFGIIEDFGKVDEITHAEKGSLFIAVVDPHSISILKSPGEHNADIVVGEGQALGIPLQFGGPYLGFMSTTSKYFRRMPGRLVGETIDADGNTVYVMTLQAREQHIRRDGATSNICSNQGLNMTRATIYLSTMGKKGIKEVAMQSIQKANYLKERLEEIGLEIVFDKPFFKEFAVKFNRPVKEINEELLKEGILGGFDLETEYPELKNTALFAVTEKRTKEEIDHLVSVLEGLNE